MRQTYIICMTVFGIATLTLALMSTYFLPKNFFWPFFLVILFMLNSIAFTERLNKWDK